MKYYESGFVSFYALAAIALSVLLSSGCSGPGAGNSEESIGQAREAVCSSTTLSSDKTNNTATPSQTVTWTAHGSCSSTAQYAFNLRDTNGVFTRVQNWGASNQWQWVTTGYPAGSYYVEVLVSDTPGTPSTYDTYNSAYFTLTSSAPCTGVTTTFTPHSPGVAGGQIAITSSATGCTPAEYRIVHGYPDGTYHEESAYTPSAAPYTYTWDTSVGGAKNAPGLHYFEVWVRTPGSPASYEAYSSQYYSLQASPPCTGTGMAITPTGHQTVGSPVTVHASATGCTIPTYRYVAQLPSGAFVQIQDWTTSSTATWNTSLLAAGSYDIEVWTRAQGSSATQESYASQYYTLDPATITSAPQTLVGADGTYCVATSSGKVDCWGNNAAGQLGNGGTLGSSVPVSTGITQATGLGAGYFHDCALLVGGTVKCWGSNLHGQLGDGTTTDHTSPALVTGINSAVSLGLGNAHTCAVLVDGSVRCWGYNSQGQLGNGSGVDSHTSVAVSGISTALAVTAGYYNTCALLSDGTVKCWGLNTGGQLGNGTNTNSLTPVAVSGLSGAVSLASGSGSTCALKSDHTAWCWGGNGAGNLGDGTTSSHSSPVQVSGVTTATSIGVNQDHGCASLQNGSVTCWGNNGYGQLGNGTTTSSLVPVPVSTLTTAVAVAVGDNNSCATLSDGTAWCWGYGGQGAMGNGLNADKTSPVAVNAFP